MKRDANLVMLGDGKCAVCSQPLGPIFNRVRVDLGSIDVSGARRLHALGEFFGGGAAGHTLAGVMHDTPAADLVKWGADVEPDSVQTICLHLQCLIDAPIDLAVLLEAARERSPDPPGGE